jgi:hypothetical protein
MKRPVVEIVEEKTVKKEEEQTTTTSFIYKYWIYIAIFVLVIINSIVTAGQAPNSTQNRPRQ